MGNTHSVPNDTEESLQEYGEIPKIIETSPLDKKTEWSPNEPSIQEGVVFEQNTQPKAVPTKSGWVSSTGGASPWYNSLSSSTSSNHQHRASISGPYYRTRGMSVSRDSEPEEDIITHEEDSQDYNSSLGVPTIITWSQGGQSVYITGTFNGWKHKIKLVKSTHDFSVVLDLPPGTHRLKFIVDDEWKCSNEMETATDPDGNLVNYLQVINDNDFSTVSSSESLTINDEYSNIIPPELLQASSNQTEMKQPPVLPPHLDEVLLNSQAVSEEDSSILYEPLHVTLNHLYACSIKDNVMALATTTRYRKKYVTTMYYRPVFPKQ